MTGHTHFLVLSSGYCGSLWLGAALDRLPQISCVANRMLGLRIPHNSSIDFSAVDPALVNAMLTAGDVDTPSRLFLQCAQRKPDATVLGDVHGWRVETLGALPPENPVLAHLVRHPVVLLERIVQEQIHRYQMFPRVRAFMIDTVAALGKTYGPILSGLHYSLDDTDRSLPFLWGVHEIYKVLEEVRQRPDIPLWGFESLINDRSRFAALVDYLTQGTVKAETPLLDSLFTHSEQNQSGRYRNSGLTSWTDPADVWRGWAPQEQAVFHRLAIAFDVASLYAPVGYSFDFLASDGAG